MEAPRGKGADPSLKARPSHHLERTVPPPHLSHAAFPRAIRARDGPITGDPAKGV
jgi:hypothetical protein